MASVSEKNGNSVSGGKPERGGLTGSGTGLEPKPIRVSVIDDDPMICQAMSLILNDYSHGRIEVVSTSTEGDMRMMLLLWDATLGNRSLKIVEIPVKTAPRALNNPDFPEK